MPTVAPRRVIVGGLVAGIIYNVAGMASALLIDLPESFVRFGVEPSAATALLHVVLRLGVGVASVLLWAGSQRESGSELRTAIRVGLLVWFIGYVPGSAVLHELGVLSTAQFAFAVPWGAVEAVTATMVGALVAQR